MGVRSDGRTRWEGDRGGRGSQGHGRGCMGVTDESGRVSGPVLSQIRRGRPTDPEFRVVTGKIGLVRH